MSEMAPAEVSWGGNLQLRNILCPVDLSEVSRSALQYAARIAAHFQARLYVQHTFDLPSKASYDPSRKKSGEFLRIEDLPPELQSKEMELRELVEKTPAGEAGAILLLSEGDPRERIVETIASKGIDLMVIGTRGRKGLQRLLQGSVTERLIHQAPCPSLVLSLPSTERAQRPKFDPLRLRTIIVATNFSPNSMRLFVYALRWASDAACEVILFHAVPTAPPALEKLSDLLPEYGPEIENRIRGALKTMRELVPSPNRFPCRVEYEVRDGDPQEQILRFAKEKRADLIVMGTRLLDGAVGVWGSTIAGVVRDGRFPVLAVRHLGA
jgi:nucleotide-binding universal stress UspA family protein